jgi:uncharacterized protein (DUF2235 family)
MNKAIVVCSDGTGNSAASILRTNVWRLYEALDKSEPFGNDRKQIAYYDDGVGTSGFKPLALLGGVLGVGLKRNLLDCYKFICRNYCEGDHINEADDIYVFGFSRGAFTVRLLAGLIAQQGVIRYVNERQLDRDAVDIYRAYRRCFGEKNGFARMLRNYRDRRIATRRKRLGLTQVKDIDRTRPKVRFVGVWDTVAAYGMPLAELTRAFDRWVWPMSMPNYDLSPKVVEARHALALDDERDTFHPLLWNELAEPGLVQQHSVAPDRLLQVWFAGMHSDVGGGYSNDSLAYVSLDWMLDQASDAELRFKETSREEIKRIANAYGPLHDSRSGAGSYYRYQPRKISAKHHPPDKRARIMQDPELGDRGLLSSVNVHESVVRRIARGTDAYSPIVLPETFKVIGVDSNDAEMVKAVTALEQNGKARAERQEAVWNDVWKRRINYFATVFVSIGLATMALFDPTAACVGPHCLVTPLINGISAVLPGFLSPWIDAFARSPGVFLLLVAALVLLVKNASRLETRIRDSMRVLWNESLEPAPMRGGLPQDKIYRWRTGEAYQSILRKLKWVWAPDVLGVATRALVFLVVGAVLLLFIGRTGIFLADRVLEDCGGASGTVVSEWTMAQRRFATMDPCFSTGLRVEEDAVYRITLSVTEQWVDSTIVTDPTGFNSDRMSWYAHPFALLRRSTSEQWFRPVLSIKPERGLKQVQFLEMRSTSGNDTIYYADFTARASGDVFFYVNDLRLPYIPGGDYFYSNNHGSADVCIERLPGDDAQLAPVSKCMAAYAAVPRVGQSMSAGDTSR